jgi:hypothetical protein
MSTFNDILNRPLPSRSTYNRSGKSELDFLFESLQSVLKSFIEYHSVIAMMVTSDMTPDDVVEVVYSFNGRKQSIVKLFIERSWIHCTTSFYANVSDRLDIDCQDKAVLMSTTYDFLKDYAAGNEDLAILKQDINDSIYDMIHSIK